jgi:hypothetical protein
VRRYLATLGVVALGWTGAAAAGSAPTPDINSGFLGYCNTRPTLEATWSCYVNGLYADVEQSKDPAAELPRLDRYVHKTGGYVEGACHMMMHVVGRRYALRHHVTLTNLREYLPRSNDPGCSAGFGMGLVMALGPEIGRLGPTGAVRLCNSAPTRFRQYTCVHSLGHAYMRLYDELLPYALDACRALGSAEAPDCAQGAFHDYWLSVGAKDGTKPRPGETRSARELCARQQASFVLPCWYRYFLELPPKRTPATARAVADLCRDLAGLQRSGCIAAASLISAPDPFAQSQICSQLDGTDAASCVRGVGVQNLADSGLDKQVELIQTCRRLPPEARQECSAWFGKTLAVVTNGSFAKRGCEKLNSASDRYACTIGASRMKGPLVTFS